MTGAYEGAIQARLEAIDLYSRLGEPLAAAGAMSRLTFPYIRAGRNAEAEEASRTAIALLEGLPHGRELATAYADQAYVRMLNRDNADGVAWGTKAVEAAEALGDRETVAYGLNMIGTSHMMAGEIDVGIEYLMRSLDVAREEGLELRVAIALVMLGSGLGEMYELERAEYWVRECIAFSEEHDVTSWYLKSWLALVHLYRGRWDEATAQAAGVLARTSEPR